MESVLFAEKDMLLRGMALKKEKAILFGVIRWVLGVL